MRNRGQRVEKTGEREVGAGETFVPLRQLDDVDVGMNITQTDVFGGTVHALFDTSNGEPGRV